MFDIAELDEMNLSQLDRRTLLRCKIVDKKWDRVVNEHMKLERVTSRTLLANA